MYDAVIVGGGAVGCAVARWLSRYRLRICLAERGEDVCVGTSKANSAICHAGFDAPIGSAKARFNVAGSRMMEALSLELDFPYRRCGALVLCFDEADIPRLEELKRRGERNGVEGLTVLDRASLRRQEPQVSPEAAAALYRREGCDSLVAVGGGSPMDTAKAAAALVARPGKTLPQLAGLLKVRRHIPPLIAVPTTAGTGSETTIAAVVTGPDHHKYAVSDLCLIPRCAVLDPLLTVSLPPQTTAETGMDALTHAVEAYLSRFYPTRETNRLAEEAVVTIFQTLERACAHGEDVDARQALLTASYQAGAAFTRASVGNVHAIAHTLGGLYGVGHGLANAVLLPVILRDYGTAAHRRLSRLAELVGLSGDTEAARANAFIDAILAMNARLGIPTGFTCIREADLLRMAAWAAAEANPTYPVPVIYDRGRFIRVIRQVMQ